VRLSPLAAAFALLFMVAVPAGARRHHRVPAKKRHHAVAIAGLYAPALQSPAHDASVQAVPAFEWAAVAHATAYQFQLAADPGFSSLVETNFSRGSLETHNTAVTLDVALPDGVYYWRARALTGKNSTGPWSAARRLVKAWTIAPQLYGPDGTTVDWPTQPLVFKWSAVPYAYKYLVTVATDPGLANQVIGSTSKPLETQATVFTPGSPLAAGAYFWAVTPLDGRGHRGTRSRIASFTYDWPTATATGLTDLSSDPRVFDPQFTWAPVPGAARYEVEVNSAEDFPTGSKWCCTGTTIGTSLAPTKVLANNSYYWRVRAVDPRGNAGVWNYGSPFTKAFDNVTPAIPNLTVRDVNGNALSGIPSTDTPLVTWDPVPGASRYELELAFWNGSYCEFSAGTRYHISTATTAWTPLGRVGLAHPGPTAWPASESDSRPPEPGYSYCVRVLARSDDDARGQQVISPWTYINEGAESDGGPGPAFAYAPQPAIVSQPFSQYVQEGQYKLPDNEARTPRTPFFTWNWLPGARAYWVVIARDSQFTQVVDVGLTDAPAYAPRLASGMPLSDETTSYYWAAIPAPHLDGSGFGDDKPTQDHPRSFNKSSIPPTPLVPAEGTVVSTEPAFRWTGAENARNYELQVAADPSFGSPLDDVTTDATAYTSSSTYPADTVLYWRVRANDWNKVGLNWSPVKTFVRTLPAPAPSPENATSGEAIPLLNWAPVQGAIGYEVHTDKADGTTNDFSFTSPALTFVSWYGIGVWRWQVRADFPTSSFGQAATSAYSAPVVFVRTLGAPGGAYGVKTATRLLIAWNPDPQAKQYQVEVATTDGFSTTVDSHRTDNTSWAPNIDLTTAQNRGLLYWRVAAIDAGGNIGSFASGSFGSAPPRAKATCKRAFRRVKGRRVSAKRCSKAGKHNRKQHKRKRH
jgi:hypothetical protein